MSTDDENATRGFTTTATETLVSAFLRAFRNQRTGVDRPNNNTGTQGRSNNSNSRSPRDRYVTNPVELQGMFESNVEGSGSLTSQQQQKHLNGLYRRHVRILLLGDQRVGKTSLILSLISEEFLPEVSHNVVNDSSHLVSLEQLNFSPC